MGSDSHTAHDTQCDTTSAYASTNANVCVVCVVCMGSSAGRAVSVGCAWWCGLWWAQGQRGGGEWRCIGQIVVMRGPNTESNGFPTRPMPPVVGSPTYIRLYRHTILRCYCGSIMNTTTTETNVCVGCHTKYICYGVVMQWCYVNGTGPYSPSVHTTLDTALVKISFLVATYNQSTRQALPGGRRQWRFAQMICQGISLRRA